MAFYIPPIRHHYHLNPKWLIFFIGLLLLLLTMFIVTPLDRTYKERMAPATVIAAETLIDDTPDDIDIAAQPLAAAVKTTPLEASLEDLLKGPTAEEIKIGQYSEIPPGTQLLGVAVYDNTVTVDLSEEFAAGGGSTSMIGRVKELKKTVNAYDKNYKLRIAINGKPVQALGGEGFEIE